MLRRSPAPQPRDGEKGNNTIVDYVCADPAQIAYKAADGGASKGCTAPPTWWNGNAAPFRGIFGDCSNGASIKIGADHGRNE